MNPHQSTLEAFVEYVNKTPVHQTAHATTDDINLLKQEIRKNSIDINQQLAIIKSLLSRVNDLESQLNHRNL